MKRYKPVECAPAPGKLSQRKGKETPPMSQQEPYKKAGKGKKS